VDSKALCRSGLKASLGTKILPSNPSSMVDGDGAGKEWIFTLREATYAGYAYCFINPFPPSLPVLPSLYFLISLEFPQPGSDGAVQKSAFVGITRMRIGESLFSRRTAYVV
jgi:hypothetical protein